MHNFLIHAINSDIHVALNYYSFSYVTYFMRKYNTGVLLVSNGKFSCDIIVGALITPRICIIRNWYSLH